MHKEESHNMIVRKVIHEELGQELEKIGFTFVSGERLFWPYEKEKDGIRQEIIIARDRYDKKSIKVIFHTNAYKQPPKEFCDFVPEDGAKYWDLWEYGNEEELRGILREFKRLIFAYGLDFLETISKPSTDAIPTEEKNRYLYEHHQELFEEYQEKLGTKGKKPEEAIEIIYAAIGKILDEPFAKVEDMLIGIAALYGHTICWGDKGEWCWSQESKQCMIKKVLGTQVDEYILSIVFNSWDYWRKHRQQKKVNNGLFSCYKDVLRYYYIAHPEEKLTEEEKMYLYEHHEELYEKYQEKLGTKGKKPEEVIDIIYGEVGENLNIALKDVMDTLFGLAALYGHTICHGNKGEWYWNQDSKECLIKNIQDTQTDENILNTIIFAWDSWRKNRKQRKEDNPLIKSYRRISETGS